MNNNTKSNVLFTVVFILIFVVLAFFVGLIIANSVKAAEIQCSWGALTEEQWNCSVAYPCVDGDVTAAGYRIYLSETSGGPYLQMGDDIPKGTNTFNFVDNDFGMEKFVVIRAYNHWGESGNSSECNYTVPTPDGPTTPSGCTVIVVDVNVIVNQ